MSARSTADWHLPRWGHRLAFRDTVSILMYHGVTVAPLPFANWCFITEQAFRRQMAYLRRHLDVIPLREVAERLAEGRIRKPTAAITFDDGYADNHRVAFPVLQELGLPATVFLATGLIDGEDTTWDARLFSALAATSTNHLEWEDRRHDLATPRARAACFRQLCAGLKRLAQPRLLSTLSSIVEVLGQDPAAPIAAASPFRMLGERGIAEMARSGLIDFGAHTHRHAILARLDERRKREEIARSVEETARLSGTPCELFAYPGGGEDDYDSSCLRILEDLGVKTAATTLKGPNRATTPPLELRRYGIGHGRSLAAFQVLIHHLRHPVSGPPRRSGPRAHLGPGREASA